MEVQYCYHLLGDPEEFRSVMAEFNVPFERTGPASDHMFKFIVKEYEAGSSPLIQELQRRKGLGLVSKQHCTGREGPFAAPDGSVFDSYEAYCNSPDLDTDIIQSKLWRGERKPQNDFERRLLKEIQEAKEKGTYLEYYPE